MPLVDHVKRRAEKALSARVCEFMIGLQFEAPHIVTRLTGGREVEALHPQVVKKEQLIQGSSIKC